MAITYRDLIEKLKDMPDARLDDTVTVYVIGTAEFYPLVEEFPLVFSDREINDVLDHGHPYLVI